MEDCRAVVQKVITEGEHGPYAVATCDSLEGSITFSLEPTVWQEADWPEQGSVVILNKLRQKRAGWRAKLVRFSQPSNEQCSNSERSIILNTNISEHIKAFSQQDINRPVTAGVSFDFNNNEMELTNQALRRANEEERYELAMDLFKLWYEAGDRTQDRVAEAKTIFGEAFKKYGEEKRFIFTVTANGEQLRVWYGRPGRIEAKHVDSCGKNLLFGVYGHPQMVEKYLQGLLGIYKIQEIKIPNGVRLFMYWA